MSILVSQAFSNPQTQLWASASAVASPTSLVGTAGSGSGTTQWGLNSGEVATLYTCDSQFLLGCYLATFALSVSYQGTTGVTSGSSNIPLFFTMEYTDSANSYVSGTQYFWDSTQTNTQDAVVTIQLPFYSVGDGTGSLVVNVYNASDWSFVTFNFTGYAQSLQYVTPTPSLVPSIFG